MKVRILILWITICLFSYTGLQAQSINIIPNPQEVIIGQKLRIISSAVSNNTAIIS